MTLLRIILMITKLGVFMTHLFKVVTTVGLLITSSFVLSQTNSSAENENQIREAMAMIESPAPEFSTLAPMPTEKQLADLGLEQPNTAQALSVSVRDSQKLHINLFESNSDTSVLLLHGVASSSYTYNKMAGYIRDAMNANVYVLDFRGHGQSGGVAGDVQYQNQYAYDIEDVLQFIKKQSPEGRIIVAGHSMGGGIALMHASLANHTDVDGYVLFAPNLGSSAPTAQTPEPQADSNTESFLKLHIPRIIGLYQLNELGVNSYDHLPVMFFNMPPQFGTNQYSYRAMLSTSPENYKDALNAINAPVITLIGSDDEAFNAQAFPDVMGGLSNSQVHIITGETHNGIRHSGKAMQHVQMWAESMKLLD